MNIGSVLEYDEIDTDQGITRTYLYHNTKSIHMTTDKQEIDILKTPRWKEMLFLDGVLQSTTMDEVIYHNALVHPLMRTINSKKNILILGGGEGATAREVLRWPVDKVTMVDYDKDLVEAMKIHGKAWSKGAFDDSRLLVHYEDAWVFMSRGIQYDAVIIDLTDPDLKKERWFSLFSLVINSLKDSNGAFIMNAGHYVPWKTDTLREIVSLVKHICCIFQDFKYYVFTAFVPSFNGEWAFIIVSHVKNIIIEPEFLTIIPAWIRRSFRGLSDDLLRPVSSEPELHKLS